jgi:addiction module HigA family antidote
MSKCHLPKDIGIPQMRASEILKVNRRITAGTALRMSKYFGNSANFWLGLQDDYDLEEEENLKSKEHQAIGQFQNNAVWNLVIVLK